MNHQITYQLQDIFNLLPNLTNPDFVKSVNVNTNDQMLVVYTASLIRSIIALHNLINNKLSNKEAERKESDKKADKKKEEDKDKVLSDKMNCTVSSVSCLLQVPLEGLPCLGSMAQDSIRGLRAGTSYTGTLRKQFP